MILSYVLSNLRIHEAVVLRHSGHGPGHRLHTVAEKKYFGERWAEFTYYTKGMRDLCETSHTDHLVDPFTVQNANP